MIRRLQVAGAVAVLALVLAWKVQPFSTTYAAHGRGIAFWVAGGLLLPDRSTAARRRRT